MAFKNAGLVANKNINKAIKEFAEAQRIALENIEKHKIWWTISFFSSVIFGVGAFLIIGAGLIFSNEWQF